MSCPCNTVRGCDNPGCDKPKYSLEDLEIHTWRNRSEDSTTYNLVVKNTGEIIDHYTMSGAAVNTGDSVTFTFQGQILQPAPYYPYYKCRYCGKELSSHPNDIEKHTNENHYYAKLMEEDEKKKYN